MSIVCSTCGSKDHIEISEVVDDKIFACCIKCDNMITLNEFYKVHINNKWYMHFPALDMTVRKCKKIDRHIFKVEYKKDGTPKAKERFIDYNDSMYDYFDKKGDVLKV